jgi:hypothetical protein
MTTKNIYKQHGARLINAHGTMLNNVKTVPKNTVLMFLTNPGYCTLLPLARSVYHDFFETRKDLEKFLNGNIPDKYIYVSNIKNRTHLPDQIYRDMSLTFNNKNFKGLAYMRKLPLTSQQHILTHYANKYNKPPKFAETVGPIKRGTRTKLSTVLEDTGPGVYVIASCRRTLENRAKKHVPINTSNNSWPYNKAIHPTNVRLKRKINSLLGKHPSSFNFTLKATRNYLRNIPRKRNPISIRNVLAHMSKNNGKSSFRTYIAPLYANTKVDTLKKTQDALLNKSKLPLLIRSKLLIYPTQKAQIIYKYYRTLKNKTPL